MPNQTLPIYQDAHSQRLSRGLDLGESLALLEPSLLLQPHNLEAVKVGKGLALLLLLLLLGPVGGSPLGVNAGSLPGLLDGTCPGTAGELIDDDGGQEGVGERDLAAGGDELLVGGGAVDQSLKSTVLVLYPISRFTSS